MPHRGIERASSECRSKALPTELHPHHEQNDLNTRTAVTQRSRNELTLLWRYSVGTYQENELICNLLGSARPQSSQLAEPLWTDPGLKSGISVLELSPLKNNNKKTKQKNTGGDWFIINLLPRSSDTRKRHHRAKCTLTLQDAWQSWAACVVTGSIVRTLCSPMKMIRNSPTFHWEISLTDNPDSNTNHATASWPYLTSKSCLNARENSYVMHPVFQKLPQHCLWNSFSVGQIAYY